jgi:hypothetical protein
MVMYLQLGVAELTIYAGLERSDAFPRAIESQRLFKKRCRIQCIDRAKCGALDGRFCKKNSITADHGNGSVHNGGSLAERLIARLVSTGKLPQC